MQLSLVCVLFDPAIPTSFFNFIQLFLYLLIIESIGDYLLPSDIEYPKVLSRRNSLPTGHG